MVSYCFPATQNMKIKLKNWRKKIILCYFTVWRAIQQSVSLSISIKIFLCNMETLRIHDTPYHISRHMWPQVSRHSLPSTKHTFARYAWNCCRGKGYQIVNGGYRTTLGSFDKTFLLAFVYTFMTTDVTAWHNFAI